MPDIRHVRAGMRTLRGGVRRVCGKGRSVNAKTKKSASAKAEQAKALRKRPTVKRSERNAAPEKTATTFSTFFDVGATAAESIAAELRRFNAALERLSKLEARLGTREDHAARLIGIEAVLERHDFRTSDLEADRHLWLNTTRNIFSRLRWLLFGR